MMNTNKLYLKVLEARNLPAKDFTLAHLASSDPFVKVWIKGTNQVYQTNVVKHSLNPVWNSDFNFSVPSTNAILCFTVYDHDQITANDFLGEGEIMLDQYLNRGIQDVWVQLQTKSSGLLSILGGKQNFKRSKGDLHFQINYSSGQTNVGFPQPMSTPYPQSYPQQTTFPQPMIYPQTTSSIYPQQMSSPYPQGYPQQTTFPQPMSTPYPQSYPQQTTFPQPMIYPQTTSSIYPQPMSSPYPQGYPQQTTFSPQMSSHTLNPLQNLFSAFPFK